MKEKPKWITQLAPISALASIGLLATCSVENTEEGLAPSVDVEPQGALPNANVATDPGRLPEYAPESRNDAEVQEEVIEVPQITWDEHPDTQSVVQDR